MLYFRGCTARERETNIQKATEALLKKAGIDYTILEDEKCCGSVLLRTGFTDEAKKQIEKNSQVFENQKVLTSCAGCYKTLKEDYDNVDVIHISQLLEELIKEDKLVFSKKDLDVTYHDSCHLGRHLNVFDAPRNVIKSVANLLEMENIRENSLCCGAGGGVKSAYPEIADQMAQTRINQAKQTGCTTLVTACPFCKLNLENNEMEVLDLCEFLIKYGDADEAE